MKKVKIKFSGKWDGFEIGDSTICYWLQKNGYEIQETDDADYVICDVFGKPPYE